MSDSRSVDATGDDRAPELAHALVSGEFFLVYQPMFDLDTGAFSGVEALIRWRHPQRGVLAPAQFLGELETSGVIGAVGRWALATACHQGAEWHARGYRLSVSVNVSSHQLNSVDFVDDVAIAITSSRFAPQALVLEIAGAALNESVAARLRSLHALGVRVAIDDFDPSASSLDALAAGPVDIVKLDRRVIARLSAQPDSSSELRDLVARAGKLGIRVIAAGVEDADQRRILQVEHVGAGQGFLFAAPHEAHEIDDYLKGFSIFTGEPL
jgi:EAL domain-containing protein (putative c-di-GMP-specific phosphodiesterase class I)